MIVIGDAVVSEQLFEISFCCDLPACKGDCCVHGDAGAPLEEEEISILEDELDAVKPYMEKEGLQVVKEMGVFDYDESGEYVTPLVKEEQCAFVYSKNGINYCAIEKAFMEGKTHFRKPVSCHLYPVRLSKLAEYTAVNYHKWSICDPALKKGKSNGLPLYKFLKDPLIRKFGPDWYDELEEVAKDLSK